MQLLAQVTEHHQDTSSNPSTLTGMHPAITSRPAPKSALKAHKRMSLDASSSALGPDGSGSSSSSTTGGSNWHYTSTAAALQRSMDAHTLRPFSAQPAAAVRGSMCTTLGPKPHARPASAAVAQANHPKPQTAAPQNPTLKPKTAGAASSTPAAGGGSIGSGFASEGQSGFKSVNITTSQAMHGLKDLYPDLWATTVPICRPDPAPNKNFISEWGESLRQGADEAWKPYLATTTQLTNLQVAKPVSQPEERPLEPQLLCIGWC